jgi:hypothetical protein
VSAASGLFTRRPVQALYALAMNCTSVRTGNCTGVEAPWWVVAVLWRFACNRFKNHGVFPIATWMVRQLDAKQLEVVHVLQASYENLVVLTEMKRDSPDREISSAAIWFLETFLRPVRAAPLNLSGPFVEQIEDVLLLMRLAKCVSRQNSLAFLTILNLCEMSCYDEFSSSFDLYLALVQSQEENSRDVKKKTN